MGLDLGLERSGRFEVVACVEIEKAFCETILKNQSAGRLSKRLKVYNCSVTDLEPGLLLKEIGLKRGDVDVLIGGPPCQSFSTAGKRRTTQDPRGSLLWEFLRWVEALEPKFFLMENVRGLLSAALSHRPIAKRPEKGGDALEQDELPGSVIRAFADDLQALPRSYHMDCFEVNAVNYGAPQLRERALFIGNRFNTEVNFPAPTHGVQTERSQADFFSPDVETQKPWRTLGDAIKGLVELDPVEMDFSPRKKSYLAKVPPGSNWRSLPIEDQKESMGRAWFAKGGRSGWWRRLSFDLPCPTLVTMPNHASTALCHPEAVRALTLKEYALIQEFPTEWEFCGRPTEQFTQVGNAVPVRLGVVAGETIADAMDNLAARNWRPQQKKPNSYRVIYVQSHVRTRQWFKEGKTFVWDDEGASEAAYGAPVTKTKVKKMA